jgi:hypothetical protein
MFREVLLNRAILVGIVFFLLVAGSSLLYNWHVRREIAAALERSAPVMQQDTYFQRLSGDEASNMNRTKVRQKLDDCTASSKINEDPGSYQSVARVN